MRLIKTIRKRNPEVQLLLFSATYNDKVKEFAQRIAPNANQVCGWCWAGVVQRHGAQGPQACTSADSLRPHPHPLLLLPGRSLCPRRS